MKNSQDEVHVLLITFHHGGVSPAPSMRVGPPLSRLTPEPGDVTSRHGHGTRAPHTTGARRLLSPVLALVGAPRTLQRAHTHVVRHQVIDRPHREEPCEVSAANRGRPICG